MCVEVLTPSKAHITFHTLPLKSKCSASVLTTVCCHIVSMYLPRGLQAVNNFSLTESRGNNFQLKYAQWTTDYLLRLYYASQKSLHSLFFFMQAFYPNVTGPSINNMSG